MRYFVTGTDTGVGKTLVCCALLRTFAARGMQVAGFKPVAAGSDADGQNEDAKRLRAASSMPLTIGQVNPYNLPLPVAPHIAAYHAGMRIGFDRILESCRELAGQADVVVAEGAGGFMVPLNESQDMADLVQSLEMPVVLVVGVRLGCLNHARLTVEAIARRELKLAGWVANVLERDMLMQEENIETLKQSIAAPLLGVIPYLATPDENRVLLDIDLLGRADRA